MGGGGETPARLASLGASLCFAAQPRNAGEVYLPQRRERHADEQQGAKEDRAEHRA